MIDVAHEADAIVTTGNGTERVRLATHVDRVLGGEKFYDGTDAKSRDINITYNTIVGAVDFQGGIKIAAMNY